MSGNISSTDPLIETGGNGGDGSQSGLRLRYTIFSDTAHNKKWLVLNLNDLPDGIEQQLINALAKEVQEDRGEEQIKNANIVAFNLGADEPDDLAEQLKRIIASNRGLKEDQIDLALVETSVQEENTGNALETIHDSEEEEDEETIGSSAIPSQELTADELEKKLPKDFLTADLAPTEQALPVIETGSAKEDADNEEDEDKNKNQAPGSGFDAPAAKTDEPKKEKKQEDAGFWALLFMAITHRVVMFPITQFILQPLASIGSFGYAVLTGIGGIGYSAASLVFDKTPENIYLNNANDLFATSAKYDGTFPMLANMFIRAVLAYKLRNKDLPADAREKLTEEYNKNIELLKKNFTNSIFNKLTAGYVPKVVVDTAKFLVKSVIALFRLMAAGIKFLNDKRLGKQDASAELVKTSKGILSGIIAGTFADSKLNHGKPLAYFYYDFVTPYNPAKGTELAFDNAMDWAAGFSKDPNKSMFGKTENVYRSLLEGSKLDINPVENGEKVVNKDDKDKANEASDNKIEDNKPEHSKDNKVEAPKIEVTTQPGNSLAASAAEGVNQSTIGDSTASAAPALSSSTAGVTQPTIGVSTTPADESSSYHGPLESALNGLGRNGAGLPPRRIGEMTATFALTPAYQNHLAATSSAMPYAVPKRADNAAANVAGISTLEPSSQLSKAGMPPIKSKL